MIVSIVRVAFRWLALAAMFSLSAACTSLPTQELTQYRQAFAATQTASEAILMDFADAVRSARSAERAAVPADAVEVRRRAMRTIDQFNSVLTTLAEGKSVAEVQGCASGFINAAQSFVAAAGGRSVPGLGSLTSVVNTFLSRMEQARARAEFEQAVRAGAPIITAILGALIEEREQHMTLRVQEANLREVMILDELTTRAAGLRSLIGEHSAPARNDPRRSLEDSMNEALAPVQGRLAFALPLQLSYQSGKPALTLEQALLAQELVTAMKRSSDAWVANRAALENLRAALDHYGVLLTQAQTAMTAVATDLGRPQSLQQISESLIGVAFELQSHLQAYGAARQGA